MSPIGDGGRSDKSKVSSSSSSGSSSSSRGNWLWDNLRLLQQRHESVKDTVHTAWRYPLPPAGRAFMGFVYFCIPVVGGWYVMQWAISKSHKSIGERGEFLPIKSIQGIGDKRVVAVDDEVVERRVGAGGWGGGVHLAVSDEETQERNRKMLNKFLRQQRRNQDNASNEP